jgi:hypothetical protein
MPSTIGILKQSPAIGANSVTLKKHGIHAIPLSTTDMCSTSPVTITD